MPDYGFYVGTYTRQPWILWICPKNPTTPPVETPTETTPWGLKPGGNLTPKMTSQRFSGGPNRHFEQTIAPLSNKHRWGFSKELVCHVSVEKMKCFSRIGLPSTNTGRATIPPIHAWSKMKVYGSFSMFHGHGCTEAETQFRRN